MYSRLNCIPPYVRVFRKMTPPHTTTRKVPRAQHIPMISTVPGVIVSSVLCPDGNVSVDKTIIMLM